MLHHIPPPSDKRLALHVTPAAEKALRRGHPWLFDGGITRQNGTGHAGDTAVIFDQRRNFLAVGLYDPLSPIRVRVLAHRTPTTINPDWFATQIHTAVQHRHPLHQNPHTTGYRLIYGEGDGLPGLIVDKYDHTLVLKLYTAAWFPHLRHILPALRQAHPAERIILRLSRHLQQQNTCGLADGQPLHGHAPTAPIPFLENGLHLTADVQRGHKTGYFFDQRNNRQKVREQAHGRRVLDLFAYSGSFGLYAIAGGASHLTSVDVSAPALQAAHEAHQHNGFTAPHRRLAADVFDTLAQLRQQQAQFDLIVVDPPAFAKQKGENGRALQAYRQLVGSTLRLLAPQGLLVMASCSSRIAPDEFFPTVLEAAQAANRPLQAITRTGHALDHPVRPTFPEGRYLKCLFATAP